MADNDKDTKDTSGRQTKDAQPDYNKVIPHQPTGTTVGDSMQLIATWERLVVALYLMMATWAAESRQVAQTRAAARLKVVELAVVALQVPVRRRTVVG